MKGKGSVLVSSFFHCLSPAPTRGLYLPPFASIGPHCPSLPFPSLHFPSAPLVLSRNQSK
jgi:hypothetical protein